MTGGYGMLEAPCDDCGETVTYDDAKHGGAAVKPATPGGMGVLCADCADDLRPFQ